MYWSKQPPPPKDTNAVTNAVQHTVDEGRYTYDIPLRVGVVFGLAATVGLLILFLGVQFQFHASLPPMVWFSAPFCGVIVFVLVFWFIARKGWSVIETVTRRDWNGDGMIGEPPATVRVEKPRENGEERFDLPFYTELTKGGYARAILNGNDNTQARWTGKGKLFSKPNYQTLVETFVAKGMSEWVDPANHDQGWVWTEYGLAVMEELAKR